MANVTFVRACMRDMVLKFEPPLVGLEGFLNSKKIICSIPNIPGLEYSADILVSVSPLPANFDQSNLLEFINNDPRILDVIGGLFLEVLKSYISDHPRGQRAALNDIAFDMVVIFSLKALVEKNSADEPLPFFIFTPFTNKPLENCLKEAKAIHFLGRSPSSQNSWRIPQEYIDFMGSNPS